MTTRLSACFVLSVYFKAYLYAMNHCIHFAFNIWLFGYMNIDSKAVKSPACTYHN